MSNHDLFIRAIHEKRVLEITYDSKEKGMIVRLCAPLDFGPSQRQGKVYPGDKYHVYDLNSPDKPHPIPMSGDRIISINSTNKYFDPSKFITWEIKWWIKRDWGLYS